ncbi:protein RTF2 homolog [Centruroides sculpturatus]|uniref:protein RTF2 homolog n=1 Tax=Centruroides sculpturatus TaxID=218467 RepID=UPI000C6CF657|nr:protein RTF2 homolog [Centruroides sculpturatus]
MGCDGGTIPRRDELVRVKKRPEQIDKDAETVAKWQHCAISQEKLRPPIVSCDLGRLYNKEAVIEYLIKKEPICEVAKHIRSLKDIIEINLTENSGYKQKLADKGDEYVDRQASRYICPVVGLEMNGKHKFCYLRQCGCVLSDRALKEVKSEVCHKCGTNFTEEDIIVINGNDEEVAILYEKMKEKRLKQKAEKKTNKRKSENIVKSEEKKPKNVIDGSIPSTSSQQNESVKITEKEKVNVVKPSTKWILPNTAKSNYSVAKDPKMSETYKSIFTSHKSAQNKPQAHWVTHNPLYY